MNLNQGDTIGIIALSGNCDRERIKQAKANIEAFGYKVNLSKNIFDKNRYLAGSDEDKLEEMHRFFADPKIKLILCARGGYGAIRLVNRIDYNIIKSNPKPFCGFSDATALLLMIWKNTMLTTYHSPMAQSDFCLSSPTENARIGITIQNFFNTLNNNHTEYKANKVIKIGSAKGILWGGNLSTVVSLCGLDFLPKQDFIFFTEDIAEPVYKIDKMLQQLLNIEQFHRYCKGIVLGDFTDIDNKTWLTEYQNELAEYLNIPVIHISGITHAKNKITLPIGANAQINRDILKLDIIR